MARPTSGWGAPSETIASKSPDDPMPPVMTSVARGRLAERAYAYVRDSILRGYFAVGEVLPEIEIASTLGISRTPVRQALGLLLQEGLVEVGPRRQVVVRGFTDEHRAEILMLREELESLAVERACSVMALEDIDVLRLLLVRQRRAAEAAQENDFIDLDEEFHLKIVEAARLPFLHRLLTQLRGFVRVLRLGASRPPSVLAQVVEEHEVIVDALEARDPARAVQALREHLYRSDYMPTDRKAANEPSG